MIIDSHCHIYPDKIAVKASTATGNFYDLQMNYDGTVSTLLKQSESIDISVIQSVATSPAQVQSINNFIAKEVNESNGRFAGLGTLHPDSEDIAGDVAHLVSLKLKGVKLHPDIQRFKLDDPKCFKIYEECEKQNLPILTHTGDFRYDYSNPNRVKPVLEAFPELKVIGALFGGWSMWEEATEQLCSYKNFFVDTSSASFWIKSETFKKLIYMYGVDKVMFGADYPMWDPEDELKYLRSLNLPKEDEEKILWKNAVRIYKIDI